MNWDNEDLFGFKICSEEGRGQIDLTSTLGKIIFDLASKLENNELYNRWKDEFEKVKEMSKKDSCEIIEYDFSKFF